MIEKRIILGILLLFLSFVATVGFCATNEVIKSTNNEKTVDSQRPFIQLTESEWKLPHSKCITDGGKGLFLHKNNGEERVTSGTKYRYATLQARIRFGVFKKGVHYYVGFMSREPWGQNVVWLNNDGTNQFFLRTAKNNKYSTTLFMTKVLESNKWYTFRLEWKSGPLDRLERQPDTASFYLDGELVGTCSSLDTMPDVKIPVVFDVVSNLTDEEGSMEMRDVQITSYGETVQEAVLSKEIPIPPEAYEPCSPIVLQNPKVNIQDNKATIENGYLRCDIDLKSLRITSLFNKYIKSEMVQKGSRFFVINAQGNDVADSEYQLCEAKEFSDANKTGLYISWQNRKVQFELNLKLYLEKNSPEIVTSLEAKNLGSELLTLGITTPLIEHIRIGEKVEDDYYFYPMMTGWCGKLPVRFRHAYGYMAWMQLLSVFDPVVGGGVFIYTRDKDGMPKNLIVNKRNCQNEDPVPHSTGGYAEDDPGEIFDNVPGTAMAVRHLRYELKAGESCQLPEAVIGVSRGDWHDSFNHYKHWVRSWFQKCYKSPQWSKDNYDYISRWPNAFLDKDEQRYVYSENMGVNEMDALTEWFGWWDYPKLEGASKGEAADYAIGDYDYSIRGGGIAGFRNEINKIHEKRGRIMLYTNPTGCWQDSHIGKSHGTEWARMDSNGKYTNDWYEAGYGYNACCYVDGWQEYTSRRMGTVLKETGADAYRLDVAAVMYPCYNTNHQHYDGTIRSAVSPESYGKFLRKCSDEARKANPDAAVFTEHAGNEYFAQFIDGYLTQQFRWDSNFFAPFRGMSAYNIVFMRFLLPEVKVLVFGIDPEDGGKRAFFNAVGQDRSGLQGEALRYFTRTHRVLIENGDAIETMNPEPLIPTLQKGLMANAFSGENKRIWLLCNRNTTPINGDLLAVVANKDSVHYMEMLHDTPLKAKNLNGKMIILGRIEPQEVICIAELPKVLKVRLSGEKLKVEADKQQANICVEFFVGDDDQDKASRLYLKGGKGEAQVADRSNVIVKLIQGKYLLDQVVIMHSEK